LLANDNIWGGAETLAEVPHVLIERLRHYFSTYKLIPGKESDINAEVIYDVEHALKVVEASMADYAEEYGG